MSIYKFFSATKRGQKLYPTRYHNLQRTMIYENSFGKVLILTSRGEPLDMDKKGTRLDYEVRKKLGTIEILEV